MTFGDRQPKHPVRLETRGPAADPLCPAAPLLKADVDCWLRRQGDDLFDELGPPKAPKPVTIRRHTGMILTSVSALVRAGVPSQEIVSLADLVRIDHYKLILKDLWARTGQKLSATLARRAELLISIGRHYVGLDQKALDALRDAARKLHPAQLGLITKNRDRLRPFDDPETFSRLVNLPFRMQAEVARGALSTIRAAQRAEMAVAIAILLVVPIRIKNLHMIEIGRQLRLYGDRMMLSFPESEVKNAVALEFEVADPNTVELVRRFIERHRPQIAAESSTYLFAGKGGPRTDSGLSVPLMKRCTKGLACRSTRICFGTWRRSCFSTPIPGNTRRSASFSVTSPSSRRRASMPASRPRPPPNCIRMSSLGAKKRWRHDARHQTGSRARSFMPACCPMAGARSHFVGAISRCQ
jgi:hypothetical protein